MLRPDQYQRAGELLSRGDLVVIPTETVYGLGASALASAAIGAVFDAKERPRDNPLIVHVGELAAALDLVPPDLGLTRRILETYAPGPITVILPAPAWAVPEVRGGLPTIAVRVPSPEITRKAIIAAGVPVAAPSANRSGRPSPTTVAMAIEEMDGRVAAILDGGPCTVGIESTIVDARSDRDVVILRPGRITAAEIARDLGCVVRLRDAEDVPTPGTRYRHYTPRVPVVLVPADELDAARKEAKRLPAWTELSLQRFGDFATYEENLYRAFWDAERAGHAVILAELPPEGSAEGLTDRLRRAAVGEYRRGELGRFVGGRFFG